MITEEVRAEGAPLPPVGVYREITPVKKPQSQRETKGEPWLWFFIAVNILLVTLAALAGKFN
jgi:hypothetical protein